jgi:Na+/melibiose symporter-like transporter
MTTDPANLWSFLPLGYALSLVLETPVLLVGLSPRHSIRRRLFAGAWLTACTYPIVILVLPQLVWRPLGEQAGYWPYVAVAEVFAPAAECVLFWLAFWKHERGPDPEPRPGASRRDLLRDMLAIIAANLTSFIAGWWIFRWLGA